MAVVELRFERGVRDLEEAQRRLGDSGLVRRHMVDLLNEGARVGERSAKIYVPKRTRRTETAIGRVLAHSTASGDVEARTGVSEVRGVPGASRRSPIFVHEGTGLFGIFGRPIRSPRGKKMKFMGRTGLIYVLSTRGQEAQPFIAEAYADVVAFVEQRIDHMVDSILRGP